VLKIVKRIVRSVTGLWKMNDCILVRGWPPLKQKNAANSIRTAEVEALATLGSGR
jgi:hypothetical protein